MHIFELSRVRQFVVVFMLASLVASCQMIEGNQYHEKVGEYIVGSVMAAESLQFANGVCKGDHACLANVLTNVFQDRSDTDPAGSVLVDLLAQHAAAGNLVAPFSVLTSGACLRVPKSGNTIEVVAAADPECFVGTSMEGNDLDCSYTEQPSGDTNINWGMTTDKSLTYKLDRSVGSAPWTTILTYSSSHYAYVDPIPPSGSRYRVRVLSATGDHLAERLCDESAYDPGQFSMGSEVGKKLSNLPENSWVKLNLNAFQDVWTPLDQRPKPPLAPSVGSPHSIIDAWSSMAWDSNRGDLIFWGGGHANYPGNDVYRWRSSTLRWERASLPSEVVLVDALSGKYEVIDGPFNAPIAAHTYDNSEFLPVVDRFITFGGAAFNSGRGFELADTTKTGPYMWDPSKADSFAVGGTTGSNVLAHIYSDVIGGEMWENRHNLEPAFLGDPKPGYNTYGFSNGTTAYHTENGLDVLYIGTSSELFKYTVHDINDSASDTYERVGVSRDSPFAGQGAGAFDPVRNIYLRSASSANFTYWQLDAPGETNKNVIFTPVVETGNFDFSRLIDYGIDFDPIRNYFVLWNGERQLWSLTAPADLAHGKWILSPIAPLSPNAPNLQPGHTGILGKWKYAAALDVFLGAFDPYAGEIWAYKPADWQPKPVANLPFIVSPLEGSVFQPNADVDITIDTLDETVVGYEIFANGILIGQSVSAPYSFTWYSPDPGDYAITVVATGPDGVSRTSAIINLTVCGGGYCQSDTIQDGHNGYAGTKDTYIYEFQSQVNFGSQSDLLDAAKFRVLLQFAIFRSEGGTVPDGATITSATLSLYKYSYYDYKYQLRPLLVDWKENEATWERSRNGVLWSGPGAIGVGSDVAATADGQGETGWTPGWVEFDVTSGVQAINRGRANYGWYLEPVSGNGNMKQFYSSEYSGDITLRPKLVVAYSNGGIPANIPPAVNLTAPLNGASYKFGDNIELIATASDADGSVARVEFYQGSTLLGEDTAAPYTFTWTSPAVGSYTLTAVAIDDSGASTTSLVSGVSVDPGPPGC